MPEDRRGLAALVLLAPLAGAIAGAVCALFRLMLDRLDALRGALIAQAHGYDFAGFLLVVAVCGAATALSAGLVRRFAPDAVGSGIPQVEAVVAGTLPPAPFSLIPAKFVGGLLAMGSGLALGREGPSVQMGASVAHLVGTVFRRDWSDCRVLIAAGAGAGLATAFNAPVAGAVFVLEELLKRFEIRIAIVVLGVSATAISVARMILGNVPDFKVVTLAPVGFEIRPLYFVLGAFAGCAAVLYNRTLLGALRVADRLELRGLPVEGRAAAIGAAVGALAWFAPQLVGGGDAITQGTLAGRGVIALIPLLFLFRLGLGAASYAAGTPGGLFAPILVLGAQLGLMFGKICAVALPAQEVQPVGFAVVGMAALFTGIVRAPLTAIVLVLEMTGSVTMLLPMMGACFVAMLTPTLLRNRPIYEDLLDRTLHAASAPRP